MWGSRVSSNIPIYLLFVVVGGCLFLRDNQLLIIDFLFSLGQLDYVHDKQKEDKKEVCL